MRFVRDSTEAGNEIERCPTCWPGGRHDPAREMDAIRAEIAREATARQAERQAEQPVMMEVHHD